MYLHKMFILLCLVLGDFVASEDAPILERPVIDPRVPSLECDVPCQSGTGFLYCTTWKRQKTNGDFGNAAMNELCIPADSPVPGEAQCGACSRRTHKNKIRDYNVHPVNEKKGHKGKHQKHGKRQMPPTAQDIHEKIHKRHKRAGKNLKNQHKKSKNRDYNVYSKTGKKGRKGKRQKEGKQQKQSTAESSIPQDASSYTSTTKKNRKTKAPISQNDQSETGTKKYPGKIGKKRRL